ncbi:cytochrome C1 family-domain-containing protein [Echria macrotheca]|uniref:quinol--cytochrome-c reductase n=1 Tax=Echria macrotheca TaxID=438768 RepID=A0AAJ0F833_9PEZI|nr:cytochrome C1 family-domain-containing protein [Echria macrotheca]
MLARSCMRSTRAFASAKNGAVKLTKRAASSSSSGSTADASPLRLNLAAAAATTVAAGSIAWYYHLYGPTAHAMTPAEEGLHPTKYPWVHQQWFKTFDHQALRRGFQVYREVCASCHSLSRIPYRALVGTIMTVDEAKALAEENEYDSEPNDQGEIEKRPGKLSDYLPSPYPNDESARFANNGALPPDLSLIVKGRHGGCDYIFSLLTGYPDEPPAGAQVGAGLNFNPYFPGTGIAMARVLYDGLVDYEDGTPASTSQMAKDVVEFLNWAAEPEMDDRKKMGMKVLVATSVMFAISVWVKRYKWAWLKSRKIVEHTLELRRQWAAEILRGFDVADAESREFLVEVIASGNVSSADEREIFELALWRGMEEWDMLLASAEAPKEVGHLGRGRKQKGSTRKKGEKAGSSVSHFWGGEGDGHTARIIPKPPTLEQPGAVKTEAEQDGRLDGVSWPGTTVVDALDHSETGLAEDGAGEQTTSSISSQAGHNMSINTTDKLDTYSATANSGVANTLSNPAQINRASHSSPFFASPTPTNPSKKRPLRGTVSRLPIPPLDAPSFGLIQESLADNPFRLLIAVTFLIRTNGTAAIPVFYELMARFPTPEALATADPPVILELIRPLGLSAVRFTAIQRYARRWLARPPSREVRFGGQEFGPEDTGGVVTNAVEDARERGLGCAWEIGHLTSGAYALDSWRIFCRDVLLGRALDWNGKGAAAVRDDEGSEEKAFQPEWMRVLPQDKELRACLRWMWMREGWLWDPETGEREPLGEELRRAVNEGRVGYDDLGRLIITSS